MRRLPSDRPLRLPNDAELALAERLLGKTFPPEYRTFLLVNNGVRLPSGSEDTPLPDFGVLYMGWFYDAVVGSTEVPDLVRWNRELFNRIPADCLTIGCDVYGNQVLLMVEGEDLGRILFWDHDHEGFVEPPADPYHNVFELAPDLSTLVEAIGKAQ